MRKFDYFWRSDKSWYYRTENGVCVLKDDAPPEAQESYRHYLEQNHRATEDANKHGYMD